MLKSFLNKMLLEFIHSYGFYEIYDIYDCIYYYSNYCYCSYYIIIIILVL